MKKKTFNFDLEHTRAIAVNAMRSAVDLLNDPDAEILAAAKVESMLREAIDRMHSHYDYKS